MKVSRRECLKLGVAAGTGASLGACAPIARRLSARGNGPVLVPPPAPPGDIRFLDRTSFGRRPGDLAALAKDGREKTLDRMLHPTDEEDPELQLQLARLDVLHVDGVELRDMPEDAMLRQLQTATLLRAVYSKHQLRERMVDFWVNHFNIYGRKGKAAWRIPGDDPMLRAHALGNFPDLLRATATSPAMMMFLDNHFNLKGHANENYAREIMELHTLGVDGGYTQKDVMEVARCFTGWGLERRFLHKRDSFRFDPELHDDGEKVVLGNKIPAGGGQSDGEKVLHILSHHPSTAHHLAKKLCRFFLGDPDSLWVSRMAQIYLETNGDIPSMLRPMLLSTELETGPAILKRPFDYVTSAIRSLDATTDGEKPVLDYLASMGQRLYEWPMPDGYPEKTSAWTGTLLSRWNFAFALSEDSIGGTRVEWDRLPNGKIHELVLGLHASPVRASSDREAVALCLSAPDFQWR